MEKPKYFSLRGLLDLIDDSRNREICHQILDDHEELFRLSTGSTHNHQAWSGGYWDHVTDVMNLFIVLNKFLHTTGRTHFLKTEEQFNRGDGLLVLFLHDIEKPWRCSVVDGEIVVDPELKSKAARREFRDQKLAKYGIELTSNQQNALKYVEGVRDEDYTPNDRVMWPLATLCHCCDLLSARLFYDFPRVDDPWGSRGQ